MVIKAVQDENGDLSTSFYMDKTKILKMCTGWLKYSWRAENFVVACFVSVVQ